MKLASLPVPYEMRLEIHPGFVMVTFEPVLKAYEVTYAQKITLEHKNIKVLVDLGWNSNLDLVLEPLVKAIESVDLILLTHATIKHLGAYSYLYKTVPELERVPVYCTYPVMTLGKLVTTDAYRAAGIVGPFKDAVLTVADIEKSFNNVNLIKYSQPIHLAVHNLDGLYITGYNSGHSLGGTMWKLQTPQDLILVSLDWNHSKDTHLNGGFLAAGGKVNDQLIKPQVLITTANVSKGSLKKNKADLTENITRTIQRGGSVLIPTSLSRALELILIVDSLGLKVPVLFVSTVSQKLRSQASTMLEWMITTIINQWQVKNESPFEVAKVKCLTSLKELDAYSDEPKVVLCTDESLETGFSRQIFAEFAKSTRNSLLFTQVCPPKTLSSALYELWSKNGLSAINGDISLKITEEVPLTGGELAKYRAKIEQDQKQSGIEEALEKRNQAILETNAEESSSDEEDTMQAEYTDGGVVGTNVLMSGDVYDYDVADNDGVVQFPYVPNRQKTDDYGEVLKPGQFEKVDGEIDVEMETEEVPAIENVPEIQEEAAKEIPLKLVKSERSVKMGLQINFLDLNGLTDSKSLVMVLSQVKPQHIIAVPGNALQAIRNVDPNALIADVQVDVATETRYLDLKLTNQLQDSLKWQKILGGVRVARVVGKIEPDPLQEGGHLLDKQPSVDNQAGSLYVGEVRLTELKKKLTQEGYRAEFQGPGVLVCNDKVAVRKQGEDSFVIEGGLDPEFYIVRQAVRTFLAQI